MSTRRAMIALAAIAAIATTAIAPSSASAYGRFGGRDFGGHFGGHFGGRGLGARSPEYILTGFGGTHWTWWPPYRHACTLKDCIAGTCSPC